MPAAAHRQPVTTLLLCAFSFPDTSTTIIFCVPLSPRKLFSLTVVLFICVPASLVYFPPPPNLRLDSPASSSLPLHLAISALHLFSLIFCSNWSGDYIVSDHWVVYLYHCARPQLLLFFTDLPTAAGLHPSTQLSDTMFSFCTPPT